MNDNDIKTLPQVRAFLDGTIAVDPVEHPLPLLPRWPKSQRPGWQLKVEEAENEQRALSAV